MIRFLKNLKVLARASNMTVVVSVDSNLIDTSIKNTLDYLSDVVLQLTSFKEHSELKIGEYDGTISLLK